MSRVLSDVRGAWRLMSRNRCTSLLLLSTFTLGLGANLATFSIARGVLLRPLPYSEPERVVMVWGRREPTEPANTGRGLATPRWFREISARQRAFSSVSAIELWDGNPSATFDVASTTGGQRLRGAFATLNVFQTLGVTPEIGRAFSVNDSSDVAVISHQLWHSLFGGRRDIVGHRLELATGRGKERAVRPITVIGVLPAGVQFSYPESTDVWLPLTPQQLVNARTQDAVMYRLVARLKPGTTLDQAHQDMAAVKAGIAADLKRDMTRVTFWVEPAHEYAFGAARPAVSLISGVALLVFVIASLNVAALLLAQAVERRRAFAVQLAVGASRWRLARQLLTESAVMAVMAAVVSVAAIAALQPLLRALLPAAIPRRDEIGVDLYTTGWLTALTAFGVIASTIVPAWRNAAIDPGPELGQSSRSATSSRAATAWRHALVVAQVAAVVVLLAAGGLLLHSFWKLQQVDLGFDAERVFSAEMRLLDPKYFDPARLTAFQNELLARVRGLPGVERASITSAVPLRGVDWTRALPHQGERISAKARDVDADYFDVMGIPLLAGRNFSPEDDRSSVPVAIVSRSLAERLYPDVNPLGKTLTLDASRQLEIVGVVGDVRNVTVEVDGDPAYYVPRSQQSSEIICLVVRTSAGAPDLAPLVRAIVASIDPMLPVMDATTIEGIVSESTAERRFSAVVTIAFGTVTLLLAAAGLYGVTSYSVTARTREIGVRMALGANPYRLVAELTAHTLRPVLFGLTLGVLAALWATRLIQRFLFGIGPFDVATYVAVVLWVLALTVTAALIPVLRASRFPAVIALRHE